MLKEIRKKKWFKILLVILLSVLVYLVVWFANYMKYVKWEKAVGYDESRQAYVLKEGDYTYAVAKPDFLEFTGNFAISQAITMDEEAEEKVSFSIIIWPTFGNKFEIGVMIRFSKYNEVTKIFETNSYQVMLNEKRELVYDDLESLSEEEQKAVDAYEENKDELDVLLNRADELWGIFE